MIKIISFWILSNYRVMCNTLHIVCWNKNLRQRRKHNTIFSFHVRSAILEIPTGRIEHENHKKYYKHIDSVHSYNALYQFTIMYVRYYICIK